MDKLKEIFYLHDPECDPHQVKSEMAFRNYDPSEHLILWSIQWNENILIMPELTILVQQFYSLN